MKHTKLAWTVVMAAFAVAMAAAPAAAKGGNTKVKPPKPAAAAKAKPTSAKPKAPKAQAPRSQAAKAKAPKANANTAKPAKGPKANASEPTLASAKREPSPFSSTPTDTDPTVPLNKAQQLLLKNDNLRLKVQGRLGGMDPIVAASGFRNLGQFVAAVNASYNKGISFRALKALMTGPEPMSLGQAMQQLKGLDPATANTVANTAMAQADAEILAAR